MKEKRFLFLFCFFAVFLYAVLGLNLAFAAGPLEVTKPYWLKAYVTVDGVQLTGVNTSYSIKVKNTNGTEFQPADTTGTTFGTPIAGRFSYNIPTYDSADQPQGAKTGEVACIELYHNSAKLNVSYPAQGSCPAGSGQITIGNYGDIIGFGGLPGTDASQTFASPITALTAIPAVSVWCGEQEKNATNPILFGSVRLGESATNTDCVVKNTGNADLILNGVSVSGSGFSLLSALAMPITLLPGGTQSFTLKYAANAKGDQAGTLTITSSDALRSPYNVPLSGQGDASIDLVAGWNLIGLPAVPSDSRIGTVLAGIMSNVSIVWGYFGASWRAYDPKDAEGSPLDTMTVGKGYWIKMKNAGTLTVN